MSSTRVSFVCAAIFISIVSVFAGPLEFTGTSDLYPFDFFARADWRAEPPADLEYLSLPAPYVVIHHTYIPGPCHSFKECGAAMRAMQKYHKGLGWSDIGYNFCVGSDGGSYEGRGWDQRGVHAGPANGLSIGICLIGDWREELPPVVQLKTVQNLIEAGVRLGKISPHYRLVGHNQAMSTECPGSALLREISTWPHYEHESPNFRSMIPTTSSAPFLADIQPL